MYAADKTVSHRSKYSFTPPFYLKNPVLQTVVSSLKFKNRYKEQFDSASYEIIINAGNGVRLEGHFSEFIPSNDSDDTSEDLGNNESNSAGNESYANKKSLIILLHGWEGSEQSAYMVACGRYFYRSGYSILRLNMRDHGYSHYLNSGLFNGTLIDEAFNAVKEIAVNYSDGKKIYIAGFSMGGNFALRIAKLAGDDPLLSKKINKIIAVNPPLDPWSSTINIDKHYLIRKYFLKKWKKSLQEKEKSFPSHYDFSFLSESNNCIDMTDLLIKKYTDFNTIKEYFSRYTLNKDFFKLIKIPVFIITSEDDPVIDVADFNEINDAENPEIELQIEKHGGHCAYIKNSKLESWLFSVIEEKIKK